MDNSRFCAALFIETGSWFPKYLADILQCVKVNGSVSEMLKLSHGVPQGSVLGPILFIIYTNETGQIISKVNFHLYHDDTVMYSSAPTLDSVLA